MSVKERGFAHIIKDLGGNKRSWESAPPWVYDGSKYVPYIYSRDEAKKCYRVQVGLVGAVIYDTGVVEIYDPELKEVRVKGEEWEVWSAGKKATLNVPITWSVVENSTGVYITREQTTSKPDGNLRIDYIFRVGARLKHTVTWTSTGVAAVTVQVKQIHLMDFDKVTTDTGTQIASQTLQKDGYTLHLIRSAEVLSEKSTAYLFSYGSKDFWLLMDQYQMVYDESNVTTGPILRSEKCLQSGEIDFAGKKVTYTFGDWTLTGGQSLEIDPDTATLNNPTEDGHIEKQSTTYTRSKTATNFIAGLLIPMYGRIARSYIEWSVLGIPDAATITDTIFKYNGNQHAVDCHIHAMASQPSVQTDDNTGNKVICDDVADGTVYTDPAGFPVVGTNKEVDLGADADTDLQNQLVSDWFAIGVQSDNEATPGTSIIYSEEYASATPKPTLYVEYTEAGPTPGWKKIAYLTEPPTAGQFNKIAYETEPPVSGAWNKIKQS